MPVRGTSNSDKSSLVFLRRRYPIEYQKLINAMQDPVEESQQKTRRRLPGSKSLKKEITAEELISLMTPIGGVPMDPRTIEQSDPNSMNLNSREGREEMRSMRRKRIKQAIAVSKRIKIGETLRKIRSNVEIIHPKKETKKTIVNPKTRMDNARMDNTRNDLGNDTQTDTRNDLGNDTQTDTQTNTQTDTRNDLGNNNGTGTNGTNDTNGTTETEDTDETAETTDETADETNETDETDETSDETTDEEEVVLSEGRTLEVIEVSQDEQVDQVGREEQGGRVGREREGEDTTDEDEEIVDGNEAWYDTLNEVRNIISKYSKKVDLSFNEDPNVTNYVTKILGYPHLESVPDRLGQTQTDRDLIELVEGTHKGLHDSDASDAAASAAAEAAAAAAISGIRTRPEIDPEELKKLSEEIMAEKDNQVVLLAQDEETIEQLLKKQEATIKGGRPDVTDAATKIIDTVIQVDNAGKIVDNEDDVTITISNNNISSSKLNRSFLDMRKNLIRTGLALPTPSQPVSVEPLALPVKEDKKPITADLPSKPLHSINTRKPLMIRRPTDDRFHNVRVRTLQTVQNARNIRTSRNFRNTRNSSNSRNFRDSRNSRNSRDSRNSNFRSGQSLQEDMRDIRDIRNFGNFRNPPDVRNLRTLRTVNIRTIKDSRPREDRNLTKEGRDLTDVRKGHDEDDVSEDERAKRDDDDESSDAGAEPRVIDDLLIEMQCGENIVIQKKFEEYKPSDKKWGYILIDERTQVRTPLFRSFDPKKYEKFFKQATTKLSSSTSSKNAKEPPKNNGNKNQSKNAKPTNNKKALSLSMKAGLPENNREPKDLESYQPPTIVPAMKQASCRYMGVWFVHENLPRLDAIIHKKGDCYMIKLRSQETSENAMISRRITKDAAMSDLKSHETEQTVVLEGREIKVKNRGIIQYDGRAWSLL